MGLLDGYFDPDQFQDSGGLLGRLLSLQQQRGLSQPGTDFNQAPLAQQSPIRQPMPWPNFPGYGQPSSASQTASQYQALRPVLGDHNAMIATVNPDIGKTLIAQALANQQSGNTANVISAGDGRPAVSDASPDPVRSGSQYAQGPLLCATGPFGCAVGGGITLGQAILGGAGALLGGATILNNQNQRPVPANKPASTPSGKRSSEINAFPRTDQPGDGGALVEGGDKKNPCLDRWEGEYNRCGMFRLPSTNRYRDACRARANDRLKLCYRNGGTPDPDEPQEYGWNDIPRNPAGR